MHKNSGTRTTRGLVTAQARRATRRTEALSLEQIVGAALAVLDESGVAGLTFKMLTQRLATGSGAVTGMSRTKMSSCSRRQMPW